jgi:hypothetical protein
VKIGKKKHSLFPETDRERLIPIRGRLAIVLPAALVAAITPAVPAYAESPAPAGCISEQSYVAEALAMAERCDAAVTVSGTVTETDQVVANPDGTLTWDHQYRPARVKQGGHWTPVDTTLVRQPDGSIAPKAAAVDMSFSGGGDKAMITLSDEATSIALGSPVGSLPTPVIDGDTATYRDVLTGVDLQLRADVDGYSQVLVVKNAEAAANPRLRQLSFAVNGRGLRLNADKSGNMEVVDGGGETAFLGNTPRMWDAAAEAITGDADSGTTSPVTRASAAEATVATMPVQNDGKQIRITPSQSLLADPATTFPVYIDPGLTLNRFGYAVVNSGAPDTVFWNVADHAFVGSWDGGASVHRSFFSIDLANAGLAGADIISADLNLKQVYAATCDPRQYEVWSTAVPDENTTWNNQPTWYSQLSTSAASLGYSPQGLGGPSSCPTATVPMDVTDYLETAAGKGWNGVAFGVRATNETDWASWKRFDNNPTLSVVYTPAEGSVTDPAVLAEVAKQMALEPALHKIMDARYDNPDSGFAGVAYEGSGLSMYWKGAVDPGMQAAVTDARQSGPVTVKSADYSEADLKAAGGEIQGAIESLGGNSDIQQIEYHSEGTGITLLHDPLITQAQTSDDTSVSGTTSTPVTVEEVLAVAKVKVPVDVKSVAGGGAIQQNAYNRFNDISPYNGGGKWSSWSSNPLNRNGICSLGFGVKSEGIDYIVTAAHCSKNGDTALNATTDKEIGKVVSRLPNYDIELIRGKANYALWSGTKNSTAAMQISGWGYWAKGQYVCRSGITTGTVCNLKETKSADSKSNGEWRYGMIHAVQQDGKLASDGGDSGGPVFSVSNGRAIIRGTHSGKVTGSKTEIAFQDMADIRNRLVGPSFTLVHN